MQYQVPQFIEREIKIVGPLTFKQFIIMGSGASLCFFFYIVIASKSFFLFILLSALVMGICFALVFAKAEGRPLISVLGGFFFFQLSGKDYFWKKKAITSQFLDPPKLVEKKEEIKLMAERKKGSRLESLATRLEIGK